MSLIITELLEGIATTAFCLYLLRLFVIHVLGRALDFGGNRILLLHVFCCTMWHSDIDKPCFII